MLLKISKLFLYAAVFCVVVVMASTFFPFIGGKDYFFRLTVELALIFFILWWAFEAAPREVFLRFIRVARKPLFLAVAVFVLMGLLASLFAYDPHAAFWSNYERGEGGFQMLHYFTFFVLLLMLFEKEEDWRRLFGVSLAAAVLMILYGVLAAGLVPGFIGPYRDNTGKPLAPTLWGMIFSNNIRFQGSLGNPAYVAPYLLFALFYALWLWLSRPSRGFFRPAYYIVLSLVFLTFFVLSQTRGAFLGLGAAAVVFFLYLVFSEPRFRKVALIAFVALLLAFGILLYYRDTPFVASLPGSRFLHSSLGEQSAQTRLWTWGSAWRGFLERPILGWGQENFSTVFDKYFDPRHFVPGQNTETWFDRAHSVVFDYLAETGALGFLSYLGMFVVFFYEFFRKAKHCEEGQAKNNTRTDSFCASAAVRGLIVALPVGYLVQGLALFDVLPIYLNLFIFLAFSHYQLYKTNEPRT